MSLLGGSGQKSWLSVGLFEWKFYNFNLFFYWKTKADTYAEVDDDKYADTDTDNYTKAYSKTQTANETLQLMTHFNLFMTNKT